MRESVGEAGPAVEVAQNLGDPRTRQHAVQSQGQVVRGIGNDQGNTGDVELAVLNFDTVQFAARGIALSVCRRSRQSVRIPLILISHSGRSRSPIPVGSVSSTPGCSGREHAGRLSCPFRVGP